MPSKELKIIFINADVSDYQHISLLHGLKSLSGLTVIDFPKSEILYQNYRDDLQTKIRGGGFSMFFLQPDEPLTRFNIQFTDIATQNYDLIVFGDIHNGFGYFLQYLPHLSPQKTAILDGADQPNLFPYSGHYWRRPYYWFLPRAHKKFKYFKREITDETLHTRYYKLLPRFLTRRMRLHPNILPLSFSIPAEKIVMAAPTKTKLFPKHIVCAEVAEKVGAQTKYAFADEADYYADLQASKFGITTKRAGWDCLRHYEIAANGAVMCFKDLDKKPVRCAPYGLVDGVNCINYHHYDDLMQKINALSEAAYQQLLANTLLWAHEYNTQRVAERFLALALNKQK
jgi:hypothetical protein